MVTLMVPTFVVMMLAIVQFGLAMYTKSVLAGAAQDGAAHAAVVRSPGAGQEVTDQLVSSSAGQLVVGYGSSAAHNGDLITVTVQANVVKVFPLFPTISVSASGSGAVEGFRPQQVTP